MTRILTALIRRSDTRASTAAAALALAAALQPARAFAQNTITPFLCRDGAEESYTVPAGVTQVYLVAAGAAGASTTVKPGTTGGLVSADLPVEPGQALSMQVGCVGRRARDITGGRGGAGYGRGGDGGSSAFDASNGAGGGGSTAVLDAASNPLLVAAGGGGAGGAAGTLSGGGGGRGSHSGGKGFKGKQGGAGGKGGSSSLIDGAPGFRSATAGSGGGGGGGYGAKLSKSAPPKFLGGGGGGETAAPDDFGGGGGAGGGASFAAASVVKARYGGRTPLGDGFVFVMPHKPWKPAPFVKVFNCGNGKAQRFSVPTGVEQLVVAVSGAVGGTPFGGSQGEGGARVVATVPVTAGAMLQVVAGCQGLTSGAPGKGFAAGAPGSSAGSSGGGGSSAVLNADGTASLVVAGGGRGGGSAGGGGGGGGGSSSQCAPGVTCNPVEAGVNRGDGTVVIMAEPSAAVTIPDPPTQVTATGGLGQATVSFTSPTDSGNIPITSYKVSATNDDVSATGAGSPITVTGLEQGGVYAFTVTAINASGSSVASTPSNSISIPQLPGPPIAVSVVTAPGTATVSFDPPEDDGDLPITSYTVTAAPGGETMSGAASPLTVTGLISGTSYTFTVQATTALGTGPAAESDPVTAP